MPDKAFTKHPVTKQRSCIHLSPQSVTWSPLLHLDLTKCCTTTRSTKNGWCKDCDAERQNALCFLFQVLMLPKYFLDYRTNLFTATEVMASQLKCLISATLFELLASVLTHPVSTVATRTFTHPSSNGLRSSTYWTNCGFPFTGESLCDPSNKISPSIFLPLLLSEFTNQAVVHILHILCVCMVPYCPADGCL